MLMLTSIKELLEHIKEVQLDTIQLSQDSTMMLGRFIEENNMELDENAATSLQFQDIISQQLSATIEAINSVQKSIEIFENAYHSDEKVVSGSMKKLHEKLKGTLEDARHKRDAYSGKLRHQDEDEIEFF